MESNKMKSLIITGMLCCFVGLAKAQFPAKYWVKFKDKNGSPYTVGNPSAFLTAKSIARRTNQNIAIDVTDIPVNQTYINQVNATGAQVFQRSKWINAAIVVVSNATQLGAINSLTCVLSSSPVGRYKRMTEDVISSPTISNHRAAKTTSFNYGPSLTQNSMIGTDCMHDLGFRGENMMIAVIDAGFSQVNINQVFDSLRNENRLLGTRDFVAGNNSVFEDDSHGANVLSCIVGNSPGNLIGTGPKASVWLLRSEDVGSEKLIEENNWIVAIEFADSVGVDIANTSLGYNTFDNASNNHVYADLDGKTSEASIAATMAARKGMFLVHAAGNEGAGAWQFINIPSDADSICTVGAVNGSGVHSSFSSIGPTADGRIKPEVSTMGEGAYVCLPGYFFSAGNGTSYASPIMAGAVACLWQANPTTTNMQVLEAIKATASKSTNPDNQYGWGIPNMCAAHNYLITSLKENNKTFNVKLFPNPAKDEIKFKLTEKAESIVLTDVLGQTIYVDLNETTDHQYTIKFNSLVTSGVYLLTIKTTEGSSTSKFIKE
jgi:subtilisin family serine protease